MRNPSFQRQVHRALTLAAALLAQGCCSTTEMQREVDYSGAPPRSTDECARICRTPLCAEYRVLSCEPVEGAGRVRCLYSVSDCPEPPGPWGTCGRRHAGSTARCPTDDSVGAFLSHMAALEAESVPAFERLARELAAHDAPRALVRAARRAARDEVAHAEVMTAHARAKGAEVAETGVAAGEVRTLHEVALENAREGCVAETFGAVLAAFGATRAVDEGLRRDLGRIARDESAHAALAWAVDAWARTALSSADLRALDDAHADARRALRRGAAASPAVREVLGWPDARERDALVTAFLAQPWGRA